MIETNRSVDNLIPAFQFNYNKALPCRRRHGIRTQCKTNTNKIWDLRKNIKEVRLKVASSQDLLASVVQVLFGGGDNPI